MEKFINTGNKDTRSGFGAGLAEIGNEDERVVGLCADLTGSLKMDQRTVSSSAASPRLT